MRSPNWNREELILALDLYMDVHGMPGDDDQRLIDLSALLRKLPIHPEKLRTSKFRNINSVAMKCANFQYLDPSMTSGLHAGSKLDLEIWNEFHNKKDELKQIASNLKRLAKSPPSILRDIEKITSLEEINDIKAIEGKLFYRLHRYKERNSSIVRTKKEKSKNNLICEVCTFDFAQKYGDLGMGFIECHHKKPIAELTTGDKTKIEDLSLVCSNCHRMLHRGKNLLSIQELRERIDIE